MGEEMQADDGGMIVAAAKAIAQGEWERLRKGPLRWEQLSLEAREVLESVAEKGLRAGRHAAPAARAAILKATRKGA